METGPAPKAALEHDTPSKNARIEDLLAELPPCGRPAVTGVHSGRPAKIGWPGRDAASRKLGEIGEEFVAELERRRLKVVSRPNLAAGVEIVSKTGGDGDGDDELR
jgi:hypothetical protein